MKCQKCGNDNATGVTFCTQCGMNLNEMQQGNIINNNYNPNNQSMNNIQNNNVNLNNQPMYNQTNNMVQNSNINNIPNNNYNQQINGMPNVNYQQPVQNQTIYQNQQQSINEKPTNYFKFVITFLLKPFKSFKELETNFSKPKISLAFSIIISFVMMFITLLTKVISSLFIKTYDYETFTTKTTFSFANLKNLDWVSLIFKNFIIYVVIIFAIAGIYYLASLVIKKNTSYLKMLSITACSFIPYILFGMVISPILGKIWMPLGIIVGIISALYSILIFINLINDCLNFDTSDKKIYYHLVCMSIIIIIAYVIVALVFKSYLNTVFSI